MKKYHVGLIGLGEVAQAAHLPALQKLGHKFSICAVCDVSKSTMRHVEHRYSVPQLFSSAEALIESEDVDIVFVLSPDQYHYAHVEHCLAARKHVFVEKPLCLLREHVEKLVQQSARLPSLCAMVGYMRRFAPPFLELKKHIEKEKIEYVNMRDVICEGGFFMKQSNRLHYPRDIAADAAQQGRDLLATQLKQACGTTDKVAQRAYQVLTGLSSHSLSAMRELFGVPRAVLSAHVHKNGEMIIIVFDYGSFYLSYEVLIHNVVHFDASIEVLTNASSYTLRYNTPYIPNLPLSLVVTRSNARHTSTTEYGPYYIDPFMAELEHLHMCLQTNATPKTRFADALEDFMLFEKIMGKLTG